MATDLLVDLDPTAFELTELDESNISLESPAITTQPSEPVGFEGDLDQPGPAFDDRVFAEFSPELIVTLDLMSERSLNIDVAHNQSVVLALDAAQLDQLFGSSDLLDVQVVYDAVRWQVPTAQVIEDAAVVQTDEPLSEEGHTGAWPTEWLPHESRLLLVSLTEQVAQVEVSFESGDVDSGTLPRIVIKIIAVDIGLPHGSIEKWTTSDFEVEPGTLGFDPSTRLDAGMNESIDKGFSTASPTDSTDPSGQSGEFPSGTMISEEPGEPQPTDGRDTGAPLPESRRENVEGTPRNSRRTLDIRAADLSASRTGASAHRLSVPSNVTRGSLATQSAVASVYDEHVMPGIDRSRNLLDAKPARLQVATFILSRAGRSDSSVVMNTVKPVSRSEAPPTENAVVKTTERHQPTATAERQVDQHATVFVSTTKGDEVTALECADCEQVLCASDASAKDKEEQGAESGQPILASMVDRLLGSPVGLVTILGLTIVYVSCPNEASREVGS